MRRLLLKQLLRMTRRKTLPLILTPLAFDGEIVEGSARHLFNKDLHKPGAPTYGELHDKVKRVKFENLSDEEQKLYMGYTNIRMLMGKRKIREVVSYGALDSDIGELRGHVDRACEHIVRVRIDKVLANVERNPRIRGNVITMLNNVRSSRKVRELFMNAKPEQYARMEELMEHRKLLPLVAGNVVTKLPDHMMVSVLTNKEFAKVVQGDFKGTVANAGKYMRVNPRFITEQGMNNLINKIFGRQYNLSEYQKAKLDILIGDMTADDFDNFYKTQYGHLIDQIFYSSDSRVMDGRTLFEFDSDIELPGEGRTMYVSEKHKLFERFTEGLQAYIGIDDESLDMMIYDRMLRSKR